MPNSLEPYLNIVKVVVMCSVLAVVGFLYIQKTRLEGKLSEVQSQLQVVSDANQVMVGTINRLNTDRLKLEETLKSFNEKTKEIDSSKQKTKKKIETLPKTTDDKEYEQQINSIYKDLTNAF